MESLYIGFWLPAYLVLGVVAHRLDARWGLPARRFLINVVSRDRVEVDQGYLVGRGPRVLLWWSLAISYALSTVVILTGDVVWYLEAALAVPEALTCFLGMNAAPALRWVVGVLRKGAGEIAGLEAWRTLRDRPDRPIEPPTESKIEAMDDILDRPERRHG